MRRIKKQFLSGGRGLIYQTRNNQEAGMMNHAPTRKGILLFEVAFVVLLVSIISLFLFRGFGVFLKAGRKSLDYLKLSNLVEEKVWELEMIEAQEASLPEDLELYGDFAQVPFKWDIKLEAMDDSDLSKCSIKTERSGERKLSFDAVAFFKTRISD